MLCCRRLIDDDLPWENRSAFLNAARRLARSFRFAPIFNRSLHPLCAPDFLSERRNFQCILNGGKRLCGRCPHPRAPGALALSLDRGCRFSLFSAKAVHANAQLFCSLGARDRENRQPLDRERDLKKQGKGKRRSQTRVPGSRLSPSGPPRTGQGEGIGKKRQDKQRCRGGPHLLYGFSPVDGATGSGAGATDSGSGTVGPPRDPALDSDDCEIASAICSAPARLEISRIVTMSPRITAGSPSKTTSFSDALPRASWTAQPNSRSWTSLPLTKI